MRRPTLRSVLSACCLSILLAAHLWVVPAEAQVSVTMQKSGSEATLLGMFFRDAQLGWAVGSGGTILKTTDGGKKWKKVASGTTALLTAVYFQDARHGWVVGANGTVRMSQDGGETWTPKIVSSQAPLYGIAFATPTKGWLVGGNGTILQTADGGATWTDQASGTNAALHAIAVTSEQQGTIVGALGTILTTSDGGRTWSTQQTQAPRPFRHRLCGRGQWVGGRQRRRALPDHGWRASLDRPDLALWADLPQIDRLDSGAVYRCAARMDCR